MQANGYMRAGVEHADTKSMVTFVTHIVHNEALSRTEGRPIFEPKAYFRLERVGERDVLMREATENDKRAYPEHWRAYQENRQAMPAGTPLAILFPTFPEIVATLEYFRVKTVEQLADLSDTGIQAIGMGGREWQAKAREFLATANDAGAFHELKAQLEKSDATIAKLQGIIEAMQRQLAEKPVIAAGPANEIAELKAQMAAMMAKIDQPRGPGRPRKDES